MELLQQSNRRILFRYMIPQMVGLVFNSVYFIVDGVFIGRILGTEALAAAGVAVPAVEVMIALSMLVSVGAGVLISAAAGRGEPARARSIFVHALGVALGLSLVALAAGAFFAVPLARALGASEAILPMTATYLRCFLCFSPFLVFSFVLSTLARNDGRPALAMWALTVGSLSNVLLDWVFMSPLQMGIGGAALATGLGPVFSVLILLPHFLGKRGQLYPVRARPEPVLVRQILTGGAPAFVSEFSIGLVTLLYNLAVVRAGLGEAGLAAYLVIGYAALICLTAFLGAAQGLQPVVSFLHGAGDRTRIRALLRGAMSFQLVLAAGLYLLLALGGGVFFGVFLGEDAALRSWTAGIARVYFLNLPFAAVNILLLSFLQSMERSLGSLLVSLSRSTVPVVLCLVLLPLLFPVWGLWTAMTAAEAATALLAVLVWRRAAAGERAGMPATVSAVRK